MRERVGKSRNTVFFQWFGAPEGRKVGSLKRRVRGQLARWEMKNCTPLWREAHFQVKMHKTHHSRTTFGSWDVEKAHAVAARNTFWSQNVTKHTRFGPLLEVQMSKKVHAVVARSTFRSQNVQNTSAPDHFWKLRCRKSARRCGAKHISKSKCTKHYMFAPLLEVRMLKKCTPLWREAHFQVKMYKTPHVRATFPRFGCWKSARYCGAKHISKSKCTKHHMFAGPLLEVRMLKKRTPLWREAHFEVKMYKTRRVRATFGGSDVEKVHAVVARSTFRGQNVQNTTCSRHFWWFRCRFASLHYITLHYTPLHYAPLHYTTLHNTTTTTTQLHSTTLHYTKLHYTTLHYTPLHYTTLHYTALPSTTLHYITLHSTTLQLQLHNYTPLQYTPLHSTTLNYTTLHYITLHSTTLHYNTPNDTAPQIGR